MEVTIHTQHEVFLVNDVEKHQIVESGSGQSPQVLLITYAKDGSIKSTTPFDKVFHVTYE